VFIEIRSDVKCAWREMANVAQMCYAYERWMRKLVITI